LPQGAYTSSILFKIFAGLLTYVLINISWVFFRSKDFATAGRLLASMFGMGADGVMLVPAIGIIVTSLVMSSLVAIHWLMRDRSVEEVVENSPWWLVSGVWGLMLFLIIVTQGSGDAFIYFQF
jgi:alginate O-acetyltransferase complex protein AlgI